MDSVTSDAPSPGPGESPPDPLWVRAMGLGTVVYSLLVTGLATLTLFSGLFAPWSATERGWQIMSVMSLVYILGFVPGIAGLVGHRSTRVLHLGWAMLMLLGAGIAIVEYAVTHHGAELFALACSVPLFVIWPAVCLGVFWRRLDREHLPTASQG